ncbi:MAG: glycosyltransferase, partial [Actinobacteria bacterium]|nr:glycosyltransferase [Actinomycetota bacterium]
MPDQPTVSMVMPCLNQARFLRRALHSVLTQERDFELECIVMDGGSTDGTLAILEGFGDAIRWVSGPDNGQSDALNTGFAMAGGSIFGWLNSDDLLAPGALRRAVDVLTNEPEVQWLYGKVKIVDEHDKVIRRPITAYKNLRMRRFSYRSLLTENWISQMGVFWRRSAHDQVGPFRDDLHLTMDYELWLRLGERWPGRFVDEYLAAFRWYPATKSGGAFEKQLREELRVAEEHAGGGYPREILLHRLNSTRTILAYRAMHAVA